jgi:hypothetical protein
MGLVSFVQMMLIIFLHESNTKVEGHNILFILVARCYTGLATEFFCVDALTGGLIGVEV